MKKTGLLNQPLSSTIAGLGHLDTLVIADAGLPIPASTNRIDLAISRGVPGFVDVLKATLVEMEVQRVVMASEIKEVSPEMHQIILKVLGDIPVDYVSHDQFKACTNSSRAVVRTGEFTPYANVLLIAGVVF